jgi:hypothetical protein
LRRGRLAIHDLREGILRLNRGQARAIGQARQQRFERGGQATGSGTCVAS